MGTTKLIGFVLSIWNTFIHRVTLSVVVLLMAVFSFAGLAGSADLRVMTTGLGAGTVTGSGINCGADCDETSSAPITLTATPIAGSTFSRWHGDCSGTTATCTVTMSVNRSARAEFILTPAIPTISNFTPAGIAVYLTANPTVNSAARFIAALPSEFKQNWILMSRSESLQTGTAESPRILLPSESAQFVFTVGMTQHSSYPGSHPNAIEYMQWDAVQKNFRFHEIVVADIPEMGNTITLLDGSTKRAFPARPRGITIDDSKCSKCHSTRNVVNLNRAVSPPIPGSTPGTDGIPPGTVKVKNKPNWDSYDSWGGMLPFNRDRIYQGSVEVAAFRKIFNPWTWRANPDVRSIIEQLELQPPGVPPAHAITPTTGGTNDGHINFGFDTSPPVLTEPAPTGADPAITTSYSFDGATGTGPATSVTRGGSFVTLHHSNIPMSDEGRGVRFFDALGGLVATTRFNQQRIADELISHRFATGSVPIDVRPIALAISTGCVSNPDTLAAPGTTARAFFDARNGMSFSALETDTRTRRLSPTGLPTTRQSLPRRKADIEKINLNRTGDPYLDAPTNGLIQQYGAATTAGTDTSPSRLRQEVFRRPIDLGLADVSGMGGVYVDREDYETSLLKENTKITLFRYFLEPLGVSVDKWSMGVRGRSRAYTFADVFGGYISVMNDLAGNSYLGHVATTTDCAQLIADSGAEWSRLPSATAVPTYTDVQRIFNKSCIECHGGLGYPPYSNHGSSLDLSEDESPAVGGRRLDRSHSVADPLANFILQRVTNGNENCPNGRMPCGGPPLSQVDIETIRRWINGGRPYTEGDPHIKTIDGVNYDFQSAGEFVLLRGENLEIQARQTAVETESPLGPNPHTGLTSCVSINTAMAVRIGPHRITYEPNLSGEPDPTGLQLRIDGQLTKMSTEEILLASGGRIVGTTAPGGIQIESPGGTVVVITPGWGDHYELWYLNIDARHARATEGVMGSIAPGNWLPALPDGGLMGPRPADLHQRYLDLYEKFADAWRVRKATSLFDYAPGTSTKTFTLDSWPGESPRSCTLPQIPGGTPKKSPQKPLKPEVAKQYCSAIVAEDRRANCVQDVMVTGEPGFAKTYLLTQQIERNAMPRAPLLLSPENFKAGLPRTVTFTWKKAADSDGDPVTYKHCLWGVDKQFAETDCTAVSNHTRGRGIIYAWLVGLGGSSLVVGLIFARMKNRRGLLSLMAITMLTAIIISSCSGGKVIGGTDIVSKTVSGLESDKVYFWKVIAEDGKGGRAESETWRFTTK